MIGAVAWKEYREHRPVWLAMILVATVLIIFITQVLPALGFTTLASDSVVQLMVAAAGAVLTYGIVCGSMMLAGERELSTLAFLDALTGRRFPVWAAKLLPGAAFCLLQALFVAGLTLLVAPAVTHNDWFIRPWHGLILLPIIALDAFVWGLLASALCRSVLTAAGVAALLWLLGWLFVVPCGAFNFPPLPFIGRIMLDGVALMISALLFCQTEPTERIAAVVPVAPRRVFPVRPPRAATVLLWLSLRQGWVMTLVLGGISMLLGLFLPAAGPLLWMSFTLVVGVLCGTSAFGREQTEGSNRFLCNQRFPPRLVWTVKIAFWLGAGVALSLLFFLLGVVCYAAMAARTSPGASSGPPMFLGMVLSSHNWYVFAPLGLLYGFGIGQFYALVWRKHVVAVVIGLLVAPGIAFIWLPSLVFGGLHLWQVLVPPLVLLAATRLVLWTWTSSGLAAWRPGLTLAACGLLALSWISGMLSYRVLEIPSYPDLVDLEDFKKTLPNADTRPAGVRMNTAADKFAEQVKLVAGRWALPAELADKQRNGEDCAYLAPRLARAIETGWPKDDRGLGDWLSLVFSPDPDRNAAQKNRPLDPANPVKPPETWLEIFQQAATMDLGVVEDPISPSLGRSLQKARRCSDAAVFVEAQALRLQAHGQDDEALDLLLMLFDLSRQLRNYALLESYRYGWQVEATALHGLDLWLSQPHTSAQLKRAREHLSRHEQAIPPLSMCVEAEYARMRNSLESGALIQRQGQTSNPPLSTSESEMINALWFAPWERQRYHRVLNVLAAAAMKAAQCEPSQAASLLATSGDGVEQPRDVRGMTLLDGPERFSLRQWRRLLRDNTVVDEFQAVTPEERVLDGLKLCRLRAMRLKLALLQYQVDKGALPKELTSLVEAGYLNELPLDPFDGKPMRYRISGGQDIYWAKSDVAQPLADVVAGQGVLWSVGLDGIDNGGTRQGFDSAPIYPDVWARDHTDAIFLVPHWR